jgi:hypothetical protein
MLQMENLMPSEGTTNLSFSGFEGIKSGFGNSGKVEAATTTKNANSGDTSKGDFWGDVIDRRTYPFMLDDCLRQFVVYLRDGFKNLGVWIGTILKSLEGEFEEDEEEDDDNQNEHPQASADANATTVGRDSLENSSDMPSSSTWTVSSVFKIGMARLWQSYRTLLQAAISTTYGKIWIWFALLALPLLLTGATIHQSGLHLFKFGNPVNLRDATKTESRSATGSLPHVQHHPMPAGPNEFIQTRASPAWSTETVKVIPKTFEAFKIALGFESTKGSVRDETIMTKSGHRGTAISTFVTKVSSTSDNDDEKESREPTATVNANETAATALKPRVTDVWRCTPPTPHPTPFKTHQDREPNEKNHKVKSVPFDFQDASEYVHEHFGKWQNWMKNSRNQNGDTTEKSTSKGFIPNQNHDDAITGNSDGIMNAKDKDVHVSRMNSVNRDDSSAIDATTIATSDGDEVWPKPSFSSLFPFTPLVPWTHKNKEEPNEIIQTPHPKPQLWLFNNNLVNFDSFTYIPLNFSLDLVISNSFGILWETIKPAAQLPHQLRSMTIRFRETTLNGVVEWILDPVIATIQNGREIMRMHFVALREELRHVGMKLGAGLNSTWSSVQNSYDQLKAIFHEASGSKEVVEEVPTHRTPTKHQDSQDSYYMTRLFKTKVGRLTETVKAMFEGYHQFTRRVRKALKDDGGDVEDKFDFLDIAPILGF